MRHIFLCVTLASVAFRTASTELDLCPNSDSEIATVFNCVRERANTKSLHTLSKLRLITRCEDETCFVRFLCRRHADIAEQFHAILSDNEYNALAQLVQRCQTKWHPILAWILDFFF
ncbi:hypothetical protein ISCGN_014594 [Ixodes scapularis]